MARLFLLTLGFHENFAIRRLTKNSSGGRDVVLLLSIQGPAKAVLTAYESVKGFASRMGLVVRDLYMIDPEDLASSVVGLLGEVVSLMKGYGLRDVVIDATGGVKPLAIASLMLGMILSSRYGYSVEYYIQSETSMEYEVRLDERMLRVFSLKLSRDEARILKGVLEHPGVSAGQLAGLIEVNYKTLLNRLGKLKKLGLVYQKGRGGGIYPSPWARIALALAGEGYG